MVLNFLRKTLIHVSIFSLLTEQLLFTFSATAAAADLPITPDGSTNTQITRTASGVDQVNIAAPNAGGMSHNSFTDYNVNTGGQVINNFSGGASDSGAVMNSGTTSATTTSIAGVVVANPNLVGSGPASIILNEVSSANNTQIRGYAEVAGKRAEVIIANPNGIAVSGGAFINTSRISFIAGRSDRSSPESIAAFNSGRPIFNLAAPIYSHSAKSFYIPAGKTSADSGALIPLITIEGLGLDATKNSSVDVVAAAIRLISSIYSNKGDVAIRSGDGTFDYKTKAITATNNAIKDVNGNVITRNETTATLTTTDSNGNVISTINDSSPLFAIDAANITPSVSPGKIFFIAKKEGLGVHSGKEVHANYEIHFDVHGKAYYKNINSDGTVRIKASELIGQTYNSTSTTANPQITATSSALIEVSKELKNIGKIIAATDLTITATNSSNSAKITNNGSIAANNLTLNVNILNHSASAQLLAEINLNLNISNSDFVNYGQIAAAKNLTVNFSSSLPNPATTLTNFGSITGGTGTTTIAASGTTVKNLSVKDSSASNLASTNTSFKPKITSKGALVLNAANLINESKIESAGNITVNLSGNFINGRSVLSSSSTQAEKNGDFAGFLFANNNLTLNIDGDLTNNRSSVISAMKNISIKSTFIDSSSTLPTTDDRLKLKSLTNISGIIESLAGNLTINVKTFTNKRSALDYDISDVIKTAENAVWYEDRERFYEYGVYSCPQCISRDWGGGFSAISFMPEVAIPNGSARTYFEDLAFTMRDFGDSYITKYILTRRGDALSNQVPTIKAGSSNSTAGDGSGITINTNSFTNQDAEIISLGNLTINATNSNDGSSTSPSTSTSSLSLSPSTSTSTSTISTALSPSIPGSFNNLSTKSVTNTVRFICESGWYCTPWTPIRNSNGVWVDQARDATELPSIGSGATFDLSSPSPMSSTIKSRLTLTINAPNRINNGLKPNSVIQRSNGTEKGSDSTLPSSDASSDASSDTADTRNTTTTTDTTTTTTTNSCTNGKNAKGGACSNYVPDANFTSPNAQTLIDTGNLGSNAIADLITTLSTQSNIQRNNDPNSINQNKPLFETRSEFIDLSKFFGSSYFFSLIGYSLPQGNRLYGDSFVEQKLIEKQLEQMNRSQAFLTAQNSQQFSSYGDYIKNLWSNAGSEITDLQLTPGISLTKDQVANLTKDIVWLEPVQIKDPQTGQINTVLAPKVYLAKTTRTDLAQNQKTSQRIGAVLASGGTLSVNALGGTLGVNALGGTLSAVGTTLSVNTSGELLSVSSGSNSGLTLTNPGSLTSNSESLTDNITSGIISVGGAFIGKDVDLTSNGNITLKNAFLSSSKKLSLSSKENIDITDNSRLQSTGDTTITAASLTNNRSVISSNNDLAITTTGTTTGSNGSTANLRNADLKNIGSTISALGNVTLTSLKGSILNTAIVATNDAGLLGLTNDGVGSVGSGIGSGSSGSAGSGGSSSAGSGSSGGTGNDSYVTNSMGLSDGSGNISSTLLSTASITGGSITITAAKDFTNLAAEIRTVGTPSNHSPLEGESMKTAQQSESVGGQNGIVSSGNLTITTGNNLTIATLSLHNRTESRWGGKKKGGITITDTITNIGSNIESAGSIALNAGASPSGATGSTSRRTGLLAPSETFMPNDQTETGMNVPVAAASYDLLQSNGVKDSNLTITGSSLKSSSNLSLTAKNNITIQSALNTTFSESQSWSRGGTVKKSSIALNGATTNLRSIISVGGGSGSAGGDSGGDSGGDFTSISGGDTNILTSNIYGKNSGNIIAGVYTDNNSDSSTYGQQLTNTNATVNIFNGTDTSYSYEASNKTRTGVLRQIPVVGQVIQGVQVTLGSTLNGLSGGNTNRGDDIIGNTKSRTNTTSNTEKLIASNLNFANNLTIASANDLNIRSSNLTTTGVNAGAPSIATNTGVSSGGDITLLAGNNITITAAQANNSVSRTQNTKTDRKNTKENLTISESDSLQSVIQSALGNINIASANDIVLQAAKISTGSQTTKNSAGKPDAETFGKPDAETFGEIDIAAGNNLYLLTSQDTYSFSHSKKDKGTYWESNGTSGRIKTNITNTEITSAKGDDAIKLNAGNLIYAEYKNPGNSTAATSNTTKTPSSNSTQSSFQSYTPSSTTSSSQSYTPSSPFTNSLSYLNSLDPTKTIYNPIEEINFGYNSNQRNLTDTGTALAAAGIAAGAVLTAGALGVALGTFIGAGGTAVAAATTTQVATTSANNGGNVGRATKTLDDKEVMQSIAIAGLAAGATAGLTSSLLTTPTNIINNTATTLTTTERILLNTSLALNKAVIATTSYTLANSLITGDSISESIAKQGGSKQLLLNAALQALGEVGAKEIGFAAHTNKTDAAGNVLDTNGNILTDTQLANGTEAARNISKSTQLTLHAALGCGLGAGMGGGSGGCASGAAAGVVGELVGENMRNAGINQQTGSTIAGVSGAMASLFTSAALGESDQQTAKNLQLGNFIATNAAANNAYSKMFPDGITDKEKEKKIREALREAAITGDTETLKGTIEELTEKTPTDGELAAISDLHKDRDFAQLRRDLGPKLYDKFSEKYMLQTGVFFDGTGNNADDLKQIQNGEVTNVGRMNKLYKSSIDPAYISGVGTSGGLDIICQGIGCGVDKKQQQAATFLRDVINQNRSRDFLFFPIDTISFSRGSTTGADFINKINNENYWNSGVMPRSHLMFDPVASYGVPGNGIDIGRDFSTPLNVIAIQINAGNETRNLFDLQSLYTSTGQNPNPNNWLQITLPEVHSGVGGGLTDGYQGKSQDVALYSMQTMVNEAEKFGINFKPIPNDQLPSVKFSTIMNAYQEAQSSYNNNPTEQNKIYLDAAKELIQERYVHDSTFSETGKFYNYSIGDQREIFYPNDKYLDLQLLQIPRTNNIQPDYNLDQSQKLNSDSSSNDHPSEWLVIPTTERIQQQKFVQKFFSLEFESFPAFETSAPIIPPRA